MLKHRAAIRFLRNTTKTLASFFSSLQTKCGNLFSISSLRTRNRVWQSIKNKFPSKISRLLFTPKKGLKKKNGAFIPQVISAVILLGLFLGFMALRQPSPLKAPSIKSGNVTSNSLFYASNKVFSVKIGERNTNKPVIEYSLPEGNKISFSYLDINGKLVSPIQDDKTVTFPDVAPNIDLLYTTLPMGLKEEIIIKKQVQGHIFNFNLNTTKAYPQTQTNEFFSSTFFDKNGNYLFHFEKPFAIDANGSRTDNVSVQIKKDTKTDSYFMTLDVDKKWLGSSDRAYPISIDPTIVHDTTSEFATGQMNRVADVDDGTLATGGDISFSGGYTIHTFKSSDTFIPKISTDVEVLVVGGGGGGGRGETNPAGDAAGGGGAGGLRYINNYSVTSGVPISVTIGSGGTGSGVAGATGTNGTDSIFGSITSTGGGGGGGDEKVGVAGGSGGGGGGACTTGNKIGGSGNTPATTPSQGNNGGTGIDSSCTYRGGAGGGGIGSIGGNNLSNGGGGTGGSGTNYDISGSTVAYAGGGGGGAGRNVGALGGAGQAGGGNGGSSPSGAGGNATANTGSGGGGAGSGTNIGGTGGSGIVIVRYPTSSGGSSPFLESYYQELPTDPNTVGLWHFNETSGNALDSSGNLYTGTPTGTTIVDGLFGKARLFNGTSDKIVTSLDFSKTSSQAFTWSAWVNVNSLADFRPIIGKSDANWEYNLEVMTDGRVAFGYWLTSGSAGISPWLSYGPSPISTNTWNHIAVVYNGSTGNVYVNGVPGPSFVSTGTWQNRTNTTTIGYSGYDLGANAARYFSGYIDDVLISDRAYSTEEIRLAASRRPYSTYTSDVLDLTDVVSWNSLKWTANGLATGDGETATASAQSALIAQWNFNETSGTTAVSGGSCGTSCNGTLTNFASTASQDQAIGTGWTAANRRWGAGALMFDGSDDYIVISSDSTLPSGTSDRSFEFWINPRTTAVGDRIISYGAWSINNAFDIILYDTTGTLAVIGHTNNYVSTAKAPPGQWSHVVITLTNQILKFYVNGTLISTHTTTLNTTLNSGEWRIGNQLATRGANDTFSGILDSTRIYNRALTSSEILANYNSSRIEFQTRVGGSTDANDGTWETWKPFASELAIDSMDTDPLSPSSCTAVGATTPDGGNTYIFEYPKSIYYYTGIDQTYTVPAGVTSVTVKMWGGGGGGGAPGGWTYGYSGGGGGYTTGKLAVTPGQVLSVMVGAGGNGGNTSNTANSYGGGGRSCGGGDCIYGGQGGGRSAIRLAGADILTAGGGGGGGSTVTVSSNMNGGGGGGNTGETGYGVANPTAGGGGGTQSAGGTGGVGNQRTGTDGVQYLGGHAGGTESYGGGGGGGWYGGGGGAYTSANGVTMMAGGGGGSGYIGGTGVSDATLTAAVGATQANASDADNLNAGLGGAPSTYGKHGKVIIIPDQETPASLTCTSGGTAEVLVVAGGGGGGMDMAGGGGGGGVIYDPAFPITANVPISVTIGSGGAGAPAASTYGQTAAHQYTIGASNGQNTIFGTLTAIGGGAGGSSHYPYTPGAAGASGGSGGGASGYSDGGTRAGGAGTAGQGFAGGNGGGQYYSGGGGGAGGPGTSSTAIAHGGIGFYSDILGTGYYWGGGGGGAGYSICGGNGGAGGGGGAAVCTTSGGEGYNNGSPGGGGAVTSQTNRPGGNGGQSTGGGGGGGAHYNANNKGGDGGSGVVIVRRIKNTYDTNTKTEGSASLKLQTDPVQPDKNTVGLWHFGIATSSATYGYSGADQTYTVPDGVTSVTVKMWGGGGGGGAPGGWSYGYPGGGGGYTTGKIAVTPAQALTVMVGAGGNGGNVSSTADTYGGGGRSCVTSDCIYGGAGGGRSAIRLAGVDILTAGGGGGGGSTSGFNSSMWGGGGGGNTGQTAAAEAYSASGGVGGTQSAGGAGGTGNIRTGTAGSQYLGGHAGGAESYGGGGGGGWYGGGGGGYNSTTGSMMGGGGGGAGYVGGTGVSEGSMLTGVFFNQANMYDLQNGNAGLGGAASSYGLPGKVIISPDQEITGAYEKDSSNISNNGTIVGTTLVDGINNKARSFNGTSDYINLGNPASLKISGPLTIEAWVKTSAAAAYRGIVGKMGTGAPNYSYTLREDNSGYINFGVSSTGSDFIGVSGSTLINDGKWHYVVGVYYPGSSLQIYLDGVLHNTNVTSIPAAIYNNSNGNVIIGCTYTTPSECMNGAIDEVRISNVARPASEIAENYRKGRDKILSRVITLADLSESNKIPFSIASDRLGTFFQMIIGESSYANYESDTNTIAFWHLDEQTGTGPYLLDSSSNRNSGTPVGTTFTQGIIGKARLFNGTSDYINTGKNFRLTDGTISFWFNGKTTAITKYLFGQQNSNPTIAGYQDTDNKLHFWIRNNAGTSVAIVSLNTITDGNWHHAAMIWGSGGMSLYIDGTLNASNSTTISDDASTSTMLIGAINIAGTASYPWPGFIDEFRIDSIARTPDEIRQAYEVGARTHNITIDFKAKLGSGNLITGVSDLGFTVDETPYGASLAAGNLFLGDKIIVKESVNGSDYIAQGTVTAVNSSTGAVTVLSWDSGSNFPTGGYTINATVFKWQREYFDITGSLPSQRDAITKITYRITDGSLGTNIWIDDIKSTTGYLNDPTGSTITSSVLNRYFQYRAIFTQNNLSAPSAALTSLTLDYTSNEAPNIPSLDFPTDTSISAPLLAVLKTTATDVNSDSVKYKINLCTDSDMATGCKTFDQTASATGWSAASYASGAQATYTIQSADILSPNTTYYWKSLAIDQSGSNSWSDTQATPYSFTTNRNPNTPSLDSPLNTSTGAPLLAILKTTTTDIDSDTVKYKINLCTDSGMSTGCKVFDQTSSTTGWSAASYASGAQATYTIQAADILSPNTTYYWKSLAIDQSGSNSWSDTQATPYSFTTNQAPNTPSLDSPVDTTTNLPLLTVLKTTAIDVNSDTLKYKINLCTDSGMATSCLVFDQTSSTTGWSAASYASGAQATYTIQAANSLIPNTTYYWKSLAIDQAGSNTWSDTQTTPYSFTTDQIPNTPSLDSPVDTSSEVTVTPIFKVTATDPESNVLKYKIILCTNSFMTTGCKVFDQTSSTTGWSAASYASGAQATYTIQAADILAPNTTYYWKSYAIDQAGSNSWSIPQTTPYSFTTLTNSTKPSPCSIRRAINNSSITISWTDNSTNEDYYQVWKVVDSNLPAMLGGNLAADTIQLVDSDVSINHFYAYLVRAIRIDGSNTIYSDWCSTSGINLGSATFSLEGFSLEGVNLD